MSGLIVGLVIELPITEEFTSEMKFTAIIYADHAWQDGSHAHPAVLTVASKTGYHERSVQRYLRELERLGVLIRDGKGPRGTNNYKFPLLTMGDGGYRLDIKLSTGVTVPPRQAATGDTDSGDTDSGDTGVIRTNQPLVLVVVKGDIAKKYEQEFGGLTPMIADAIDAACKTYPLEWIPEAMQIAVASNKRSWKYVEGILKNCKAKNIRPSLNRLENPNGNTPTAGNRQRTKQPQSTTANTPVYSDADLAAAARVRERNAKRKPVAVS